MQTFVSATAGEITSFLHFRKEKDTPSQSCADKQNGAVLSSWTNVKESRPL